MRHPLPCSICGGPKIKWGNRWRCCECHYERVRLWKSKGKPRKNCRIVFRTILSERQKHLIRLQHAQGVGIKRLANGNLCGKAKIYQVLRGQL